MEEKKQTDRLVIEKLQLKNFRGFRELEFSLHDRLNVIVGENGSGKSSLLKALEKMLYFSYQTIRFSDAPLLSLNESKNTKDFFNETEEKLFNQIFDEKDRRVDLNSKEASGCSLQFKYKEERFCWDVIINNSESKPTVPTKKKLKELQKIMFTVPDRDDRHSPLPVFYPTNRSVMDNSLESDGERKRPEKEYYHMTLIRNQIDFQSFFQWFWYQEDLENEHLRESWDLSSKKIDFQENPQLKAVRQAIQAFLPEFSKLRVKRNLSSAKFILSKKTEEGTVTLDLNQLSDGEKCLLAMVGDLARQLSDHTEENPLEGQAIVLIDEIELHLHPSWQGKVISSLLNVFPHCQFIITTHSPQVISHIPRECLFILENFQLLDSSPPIEGRDSNSILTEVMGSSERPENMKNRLEGAFGLIDKEKLEEAREKLDELRIQLGENDPELIRAYGMIDFLEE